MFFASWISIKEGKNGNCDLICEISDSIPKEARDQQHRSVGQEFVSIPKGKGALLMPVPELNDLRGPCRRHPENYRDRNDRFDADAIIYATAELHDADILTLDAHFKDLERTVYFEKA
ncbi:hypothetical protein [Rhizobium mongolense]